MTHQPTYPAMSHPTADPALNAVAARLVGLKANDPARSRILELGCGSGHHLLPLAARWAEAELLGIDRDEAAIALARGMATEAGLANVVFRVDDLEDGEVESGWDFIIAHGVFSWVPDASKLALFRMIASGLAPHGVAVVSFNVAAGWRVRLPLVAKARAIQHAGEGVEVMRALEILRDVCESDAERAMVDDMRAKGAAVLAHDDFAGVNDPFALTDFVALAANHGLRWLGEGVPADNLPATGAALDEPGMGGDLVAMQHAHDVAGGRTFRSAMLCRSDAAVEARVSAAVVSGFHLTAANGIGEGDDAVLRDALAAAAPADVMAGALIASHGPAMATRIVRGIFDGTVMARTHPAAVSSSLPAHPRLDELRLACARRRLPVVDAHHKPCAFPHAHYDLLAQMDGSRSVAELEALAQARCPELAFTPWMRHLAERGFFG